jgi:hypothetical protein
VHGKPQLLRCAPARQARHLQAQVLQQQQQRRASWVYTLPAWLKAQQQQ